MIILDKVIVSSDVISEHFVCDLEKCKGACCVEGDLGAPLEESELDEIDNIVKVVNPYLSDRANSILENEGGYLIDEEGEYSTTTIAGKECSFAFYDQNKILKCSIEQAWKDGKTTFRKPISCHLYPIRLQKLDDHIALNYDRWSICSAACDLGKKLSVPIYKFLKEPLIRKFGKKWYQQLVEKIKDSK